MNEIQYVGNQSPEYIYWDVQYVVIITSLGLTPVKYQGSEMLCESLTANLQYTILYWGVIFYTRVTYWE